MSSSAHFIPIVCSSSLSTISLLLQGTPSNAHFIPMRAIFLPIILLQVAALSFAVWRFFDRLLTKLQDGIISQGHISVSSKVNELFMMIQYGSRFYLLFNTTLSIMFSNCTPTVCTFWVWSPSLLARLLHWWSIDQDSREEQAHLCYANNIGYPLQNSD
jgi:hypothetical protein